MLLPSLQLVSNLLPVVCLNLLEMIYLVVLINLLLLSSHQTTLRMRLEMISGTQIMQVEVVTIGQLVLVILIRLTTLDLQEPTSLRFFPLALLERRSKQLESL